MIEDATYIALSLLAAVAPSFLMWKVLSLLWNGVVRRKRDRLIRDLETEGAREAGWLYSDDEIQQLKDEIDKPKRCFAGLFDKITKKDIEDSFRDPPPPTWMKFEKEETCGKNLSADDIMRMRDRMEMIGEPLPCRTAGPAEEEGVKVGPFHHVTLTIDSRIPITIDQQRHGVRLNGVEDHMREVTHAVGQTIWTQKVTVMLDTVSFGRVVDYHAVHWDG